MQPEDQMPSKNQAETASQKPEEINEDRENRHGPEYGPLYGRPVDEPYGLPRHMTVCPWCGGWIIEHPEEGPHRGAGPATGRTDEEIKTAAERAITEDSWLDASSIKVTVQDGIATLEGTVISRQAKRGAEIDVDRISGVRDVRNHLDIIPKK
jgi:hypothetical protein